MSHARLRTFSQCFNFNSDLNDNTTSNNVSAGAVENEYDIFLDEPMSDDMFLAIDLAERNAFENYP